MKDSYLNFTNVGIGARLTSILGLPRPEILERYETEKPTITGAVLLGGGGKPELLEVLATLFESMRTQTLFHSQIPECRSKRRIRHRYPNNQPQCKKTIHEALAVKRTLRIFLIQM